MKAVRVPRGTYFKHAVGTTGLDERQRGAIMSYNASLTQCPQRSCGNYLEDGHVGAHVQIEGHSGMWIIPTCKDCNTEAKNIADVNVYNTNEWVDLTAGAIRNTEPTLVAELAGPGAVSSQAVMRLLSISLLYLKRGFC